MSTETEQYYGRARGSGVGFKIFKYFFKSLALILIFGTTAFFLWRVFSSGNPKSMEGLVVNETVHEAYLAVGEDMGKALGQAMLCRLPQPRKLVCMDGLDVKTGAYLDVGSPVGSALPVVIKTLIFTS